jgi:hypothetical protein
MLNHKLITIYESLLTCDKKLDWLVTMKKFPLLVIAVFLIPACSYKQKPQEKIAYLSSSKFITFSNDANNFRSMASLVVNMTPSKIKNWPYNSSKNFSDFKDYLVNFNVESAWDNYNQLLKDIGYEQETCRAIPNMSYPIPIVLKNDKKKTLAAIISSVGDSFILFVPKKGLYSYNCTALLNNWTREYLGFYGIARSKIKLP